MLWKKRIYLDLAAGMRGNPSSPHEEGRRAKQVLERARVALARLLEVQADDLLFTSGATESNALAILGHVRALRKRAGPDAVGRNNMHVLYLPSAHASIVENVRLLSEEGITVEALPISHARIDTDQLATMIRPETVLVTLEAVCGETGIVWNTREVHDVLTRMNGTAKLHVDASQAPHTEKLTRAHFAADMLTLDGAKVGVRGIGVLVVHRTIALEPLYRGGGQERGLRAGSEDPERAREFAAALRAAANSREAFVARAARDRAAFVEVVTAALPHVVVHASRTNAPNVISLSLVGRDTDFLVALLDEAGYALSTRSACETDSREGSRAVFALTHDAALARSTLRISWSEHISRRDLTRAAHALVHAVQFIDMSAER